MFTAVLFIRSVYNMQVCGLFFTLGLLRGISGFQYNYVDSKIYTFAFTGLKPRSYFNGSHLVGPRVELTKEVCCRASKRCDTALVEFKRCWDGNGLSEVLNGRWYDVCSDLSDSSRRKASYSFSRVPFQPLPKPAIVVAPDSNIIIGDLRNLHDFKVAYMSFQELVVSGILEKFMEDFFVKSENIVAVSKGGVVYDAVNEIIRLINDPCSEIDIGLVTPHHVAQGSSYKTLAELDIDLGNSTIMVRKDDQHILDWWDYTLKRFMCSEDWKPFCDRLDELFGKNPINCPPTNNVDCSDCRVTHRVPGCDCPTTT